MNEKTQGEIAWILEELVYNARSMINDHYVNKNSDLCAAALEKIKKLLENDHVHH